MADQPSLTLKTQPRLLLVEDEPDEAQLISWQLTEKSSEAFRVKLAGSLADIQAILASGFQPDVILLDLNLPDSTGLDTLRRVNELVGALPIVIHTGRDDFALTQAAIELGAQDYLIKGVDSWVLRKSLRYALLRHERDAQDRLARSVFEHASEAILITDAQGHILQVNEAFSHITGYSREEALGQTPALLKSGHHTTCFYQQLWERLLAEGQWEGEVWNRRKNGELYAQHLNINAVQDAQGRIAQFVALFSDITLKKEEQLSLHHKANHDALTGLPNRNLLLDRLEQAVVALDRYGGRLAVVFLDLDGFKPVNDTYGHDAGDKILQEVSQRLLNCLRAEDTLARLGGDEFVLLLPHQTDMNSTVKLLQRLLHEVNRPYPWKHNSLQVSASLGVSLYTGEADLNAEQLLQRADEAMYQAKSAGKNTFRFYDAELAVSAAQQVQDQLALREALDQQQLELYFQPIVDLQTGETLAVEALLRWQHPSKGLLLPDDFMLALEDEALLKEIQCWVLEAVLEQLNRWYSQGRSLPIITNLCRSVLKSSSFIDEIYQLCVGRLPAPKSLFLEVKELDALEQSTAMEALHGVCEKLDAGLVLDDFGAGYSSLSFLKRLGVAEIKTDRAFIQGMLGCAQDLAVVEASLGLATAFRCRLTAKGVEQAQQYIQLTRLGCHQAQGNYLCLPLPLAALESWLAAPSETKAHLSEYGLYQREDLPLLTAAVDHRAWIQQLEDYLGDRTPNPPALHHTACRFGRWWHAQQGLLSQHPLFHQLGETHTRVHQTGEALIAAKERGDQADLDRQMLILMRLKAELLKGLESLLTVNKQLMMQAHPNEQSGVETAL